MNWFTVVAEIFNFTILILLLNRFLYKPLLKTLNARKEEIRLRIEDSERKLAETEKLKDEYHEKLARAELENQELRERVVKELAKYKESELVNIKHDISNRRDKFNEYLALEEKNLLGNFNDNINDLFIEYSNVILSNLANSNLNREVVNRFVDKINELKELKVNEINGLHADVATVFSSDKLDEGERLLIKDALVKKGFIFENVEFLINKNLVLGVELKIKSFLLSWNVKGIVESFMGSVDKKTGGL